MTRRPPRLAEALLERWLPADQVEFALGDLAEQFADDVAAGRRLVAVRYWRQALSMLWHVRRPRQAFTMPSRAGNHPVMVLLFDLGRAAKTLRRTPGFTATVTLILALGIGAVTVIFSVVHPILLSPLPYDRPDDLVMVWERGADGSNSGTGYATFVDLAAASNTLESGAAMAGWRPTVAEGTGAAERLAGQSVTWRFFETLGVSPLLGRSFVQEEDRPNQPRVAILTHGLWQRRFGADSGIVGRDIALDGRPYQVVGVLPASFEDVFRPGTQIYRPLGYEPSLPWACRTCRHLRMVGRIDPSASHQAASAELNTVSTQLVAQYPTEYPAAGVNLVRVQDEVTRRARPALLAVMVAAGFLLLIACANVTNLQLARAVRRAGEFAVRTALGAGRLHLGRQLLAEGMVLAALGGIGGLVLAHAVMGAVTSRLPADLPRLAGVELSTAAFGLAALVTLGVGILVGLTPLAVASGRTPFNALRTSTRSSGGRRRGGRAAIVVAEVALALMLLVGTGLMARSIVTLMAVDPGFAPEHLLTLEVQSTGPRYAEDEAVWDYHDRVREAALALPGVTLAAVTTQLPLGGNFDGNGIAAEDKPLANPELAPSGQRYGVSPDYFRTMGIPLLEGREFEESENVPIASDEAGRPAREGVAIVSAALARRIWGGESAVGKRIRVGGPARPWLRVVGVVGDVRHTGLDEDETQGFYVPERQWWWADTHVVLALRTADRPVTVAAPVRAAVAAIDPAQPITNLRTGEELVTASTAQRRLALLLFAAFGLTAVLLSAAGVYGVLAGAVDERRREIGIRAALGATPRIIARMVLGQGLVMTGIGMLLGVGGAVVLTRYLRALLFEIAPSDPATIAGTVCLLAAVAFAACLVPMWRALAVDPMSVLRSE